MSFLTGIEIRSELDKGIIRIDTLDNGFPFDSRKQVTEDSIDLRLFPKGLRFKAGLKEIDFLADDLKDMYESVSIDPVKGFLLKPNHILFGQTLEAITFPDFYVGLMLTRCTFAQLGIMVTCGAPKFAAGISWAFPLQITNCGPVAVRIYPFAVVAQLMIAKTTGVPVGYPSDGRFQRQYTPKPPEINNRERNFLKQLTADSAKRVEHIETKILEVSKAADEQKLSVIEDRSIIARYENRRKLKKQLFNAFYGIMATGATGYLINLLPTASVDHPDRRSLIMMAMLCIIAFTFTLLLITNNNRSSDD